MILAKLRKTDHERHLDSFKHSIRKLYSNAFENDQNEKTGKFASLELNNGKNLD